MGIFGKSAHLYVPKNGTLGARTEILRLKSQNIPKEECGLRYFVFFETPWRAEQRLRPQVRATGHRPPIPLFHISSLFAGSQDDWWEAWWGSFGVDHCCVLLHDLLSPRWLWVRDFLFLDDFLWTIFVKNLSQLGAAIPCCCNRTKLILLKTVSFKALRFSNVDFRNSFGLLLPAIADQFKVGRAEAALTSSFMNLLTLGSGQHCCNIQCHQFDISWPFTPRTTGRSLVDLFWPPQGVIGRSSPLHRRPPPCRPLHPALHKPLHRRPLPHHRPPHRPRLWSDVPACNGHRRPLLQPSTRPCHGSCLLRIWLWPVCPRAPPTTRNTTPRSHWHSLLSFSNCCCSRLFCAFIQVRYHLYINRWKISKV